MSARIFKVEKPAMQSISPRLKPWVLVHDSNMPDMIDPLMGWSGNSDPQSQIHLSFETREEAEAYARRKNISYVIDEPSPVKHKAISYTDNFVHHRKVPWTH